MMAFFSGGAIAVAGYYYKKKSQETITMFRSLEIGSLKHYYHDFV